MPFGRNKDFIGRENVLQQILRVLPPGADDYDCQRVVIEGLGGVGKTQIALEAAFRVRNEFSDCSVFWVPAVDATAFENAYREIGQQLKISGIGEDNADVKLLVKTALSESDSSWLLIVDNADDIQLLYEKTESTALIDYLPFNRKGSILFTTRNHEVTAWLDIPGRNVFTIEEMSRDEAVEMLKRYLKESQTRDVESMNRLLDFLTSLPLAIRQASAYMARTGISTTRYLQHCQSSDVKLVKLLSKDFMDRSRYKIGRNPVATTWLISFDHISRDNKLATQYLRFMSFLAEKDIPASLLPPAGGKLEDNEDDALEKEEAIGILKAYAFISERTESGSFDMHRLVRLVIQNWLKQEANGMHVSHVIQRLAHVFPFPRHENRELWIKYLPHAQTALGFLEDGGGMKVDSDLLSNIGSSLGRLGKFQQSAVIHQQTLELREKVLGKEHPSTLTSMNNLAKMLHSQGKHEQAGQIHRQTLQLRENTLGKDHPDTLDSMNNVAEVLRRLGNYEEARQLYQQTLKLRQEVLGKEHRDTLDTMNNLALALHSLGKYSEAEKIHRDEWKLSEKILGREHPETLESMNNLALLLNSQGKYNEAEQMHREEWKLTEKVLGKEHPSTLISRYNLANALHHLGNYDEAAQMHRQTLELAEKVLGKEHPDTMESMSALAQVLESQGKFEEAYLIQKQASDGYNRLLGHEHPDTLWSMTNLAVTLHRLGKYDEAEQMQRQTLELTEKVLGKEHRGTLESMNALGQILESQGKFREAHLVQRQALDGYNRLLGSEHPDTLGSMNNLAVVLYGLGQYDEAERMQRQTLELREKVLGKGHPDTLASRNMLMERLKAKEEATNCILSA